ncbi:T9SS type A sorting domain-containing protein [Flavobacterium psychrotolerans]|uniref:Secretion system C-terminal sorting domain-containing protein n=1 Tax=Flavobacterium psychrotolerans TaxID=2169410 RepID=A0A2U1JHA3_9FLAO|nr:T9SS type A sorting domain-containing protein [Flavobacterium psychrotolerans]PWA04512.1 hypothetical protein DB895_10505 [Flavobacterium psychrotolerans]
MKKTLLSLLLAISSGVAFAQWTQLPTEGGSIKDMITVPSGILLATEGGVFKSIDGGNTWAYSSNGLFAATSAISCGQFANTSTAYFVQTNNGIAKTTDNGTTWVAVGNTGMPTNSGNYSGLVSVSNKLYVCRYTAMNTYQIFTSITDGATWTAGATINSNSNNNSPKLFNVGGTIYVTLQDSIFTTTTGASLTAMSTTGFPVTGDQIGSLVGDSKYLYAGFENDGGSFLRYDMGTSIWESTTSGIPAFRFSAGPHLINNILYVSVLTTSMTLQTYTSSTQGATWNQITLPGLTKDFVEKIYSLGGSKMLLYNPVDELNTSTDNGSTWTQHITGFKAEVFRDTRGLTYSNGNLIASQDLSIVRSTNGGMDWVSANSGMPTTLFFNYSLYNANNTIYSSFMDLNGRYLYKSTDGAVSWKAATTPPGTNDIRFFGHSNTALFLRVGSAYYSSKDAGGSWTDITANLNVSYNYDIPFVSDGKNVYVLGKNGSTSQIFTSNNDGGTWNTVSMTGIPSPNGYIADNLFVSEGTLMSLWADFSSFPSTYKMCTYTGTDWTSVTVSGLPQNIVNTCTNCGGNYYDTGKWFSNASNLYFMTNQGLFYSTDKGATFNAYSSGFYPGVNVSRLASDGVKLFAGTEGNSIWSVTPPLGINGYSKSESLFDIYPNPAVDHVMVTYNADTIDATSKLIVTNMLGAIIQEVNLPARSNQMELSTSNLKSGIYFYTMTSNSKKSVTKKIVISK